MFLSSLSIAFILYPSASFVLGAPGIVANTWGHYETVESIDQSPSEWTFRGPASDDDILSLRIVVKSEADQELATKLTAISSPESPEYGYHLSQEQLATFVAPKDETVELIASWLSSFNGISDIAFINHTSSISFLSTVKAANQLLKSKFGVFQMTKGGAAVTRSLQYSLPENIRQHVALVHPVTYFPTPQSRNVFWSSKRSASEIDKRPIISRDVSPEVLAACNTITPTCIAAFYNITYTPPTNTTASGSSLGVVGFLEQYINHTDITSFVRKYGNSPETRANPGSFTVELVNNGTNNESSAGIEATLDMEFSMPFTGSLPVVYYSVGGRPPTLGQDGQELPLNQSYAEPYLEWLQYMLAKPDGAIPQVISISYTDTEQTVPRDYAVHVCDLFGRLALRGVSIIDASGDGGVAGQDDVPCVSNDGQSRANFLPTFPASCPWVTSIGSTSVIIDEQGSSFSSGGFSNYFAVPDYQRNATESYIKTLNGQYEGLYNASGRGIPDVAVYGSRYETENNNVTSGHHSGTSAGTPVFASMIALINDIRLRNGKPVLGWLNPTLYSESIQDVWNDIRAGVSYGCDASWNASVGWDAVTGLGSPDFQRLATALS
ncbi:related to Tripeptidyl-peptidase sed2 [Phialocephala subalpina]|uniref:tripeptidyl-peptidase II n=1 Tax=Phialocephala subalpina TaxID=576137 RepID=A0A1L7WV76_9HELO|nr:related to Tripeptidyl-peptidase sed2 [Phialocephala subalpina]